MDNTASELSQFISQRPHLIWYANNYDTISPQAVLEAVLNYGTWDDYLTIQNILSLQETYNLYNEIKNKKRTNLSPRTSNYFTLYLEKHAPRNT